MDTTVEPSAPPADGTELSYRTGSPYHHNKDSTNQNTPASEQPSTAMAKEPMSE